MDLSKYDLFPDSAQIHRWDEEEQQCPVLKDDKGNAHKHHMRCSRCRVRRHGAFAEQGAPHYFTHDHQGGLTHEAVPPCTGDLPTGYELVTVQICIKCDHFAENGKCPYGHTELVIPLRAIAKRKAA